MIRISVQRLYGEGDNWTAYLSILGLGLSKAEQEIKIAEAEAETLIAEARKQLTLKYYGRNLIRFAASHWKDTPVVRVTFDPTNRLLEQTGLLDRVRAVIT